jgi:hypothetical protein
LLRHSEKGTMSSEGRQRLSGKSSVRGMVVLLSFLYFVLYKILSNITRGCRQILFLHLINIIGFLISLLVEYMIRMAKYNANIMHKIAKYTSIFMLI